jgi:hypothetical protein
MYWAQISQETSKLIVHFYPHPNRNHWEFSFEDALAMLEGAKNKLLRLNIKRNS